MGIVGGIDIHRRQLTFDLVDLATGENVRGRVSPADRVELRRFLVGLDDDGGDVAMEGCTGWRYVTEKLERAGFRAHVAEPADTAALRGNKRRAKTDRSDARHLRKLLMTGELPESWIPPHHVLEARAVVRLYKDLADQRVAWTQRLHATLYHHGVSELGCPVAGEQARTLLHDVELSPAARRAAQVALAQIEIVNEMLAPIKLDLARLSRHQPGCQALTAHYGIGPVTSVAIWSEMGDTRRFSSSSDAVRHAGLDVAVYQSDTNRGPRGISPDRAQESCAGRYTRPPCPRRRRPPRTMSTSARFANASGHNEPPLLSPGSWRAGATTPFVRPATTPGPRPPERRLLPCASRPQSQ